MATGTVQVVAGCIAEDPVPTPEKPDAATYEGGDADEGGAAGERPDVVEAKLTGSSDGQCTATVTISSPYDTPERYVDEWRVLTPEGDELSEHKLGHDHADEQRFTRENQPFANHDRVDEVTIEGRDLVNGYRGETATVEVPERDDANMRERTCAKERMTWTRRTGMPAMPRRRRCGAVAPTSR